MQVDPLQGNGASIAAFAASRARGMFQVAWVFFGIAALIGFLLRMQFVYPISGFPYGNMLHTHSHVAFLGWIYNAFFALSIRFFIPPEKARVYWRLFLFTQISVVGILVTFPLQGYAAGSIFFSSLHMVCAAAFICAMLRRNRAGKVARGYLWAASIFMLASSLGPLAVGPIMVAGLGDSPWHGLAVGYYLHFQYNGWFLFFLMATLLQAMRERSILSFEKDARRALPWLAGGCILTFALSALPASAASWIYWVAAAGGIAQLVGCFYWVRGLRGAASMFFGSPESRGLVGWLARIALGLFLLKMVLQSLAALPPLLNLVTNHFTIIVFMHLIFLGVLTPMLIAWAIENRWLRMRLLAKVGLVFLAGGAFTSQLALAYTPLAGAFSWTAWPGFAETQFVSACCILIGVALIGLDQVDRRTV